ncbi:MAG: restriction endonuclease subunit S [Akkermansia sp.]|nr:restriction endonuclease subunit S [Akkermansia sp.]
MKVKLGNLTKIRTGKLDANASSEDGAYPFFTCSREPLKINTYSYECECILVAGNGDLNVKYYNGKFDAYQRTYIIEAKQPNVLYMPYLYYFMEKYIVELRKLAIGGVIKYIKLGNLTEALIELPSYNQQRSLVERLEKVKSAIDKRNKQLAKLDELVKCRFVELFGDIIRNDKKWAIYNLGDITSSRLGKMLDTKHKTGRNNYPYLANFNVQWFHFELNQLNKMDFDDNERIEFQLKEGDILVCEGGEIGRCAVWHNELKECFFQKALHRVRCDVNKVLPDYVAWWFKYNCDHKAFDVIAGAKATIAHLPGVKLKKLRIAVPDIQLQRDFTIFLRRIYKLRFVIQQSLDETQKLFDSLMQEYFD